MHPMRSSHKTLGSLNHPKEQESKFLVSTERPMTDAPTYPLSTEQNRSSNYRGTPRLEATTKKRLMEKTPVRTAFIYANAVVLILLGIAALALDQGGMIDLPWYAIALDIVFLGLIYAHFTELQHELLHGHAFKSQRLNRGLGFVCGVFMLNSFSHYKYHHLRHHRHLGTELNSEFFNYPEKGLNSPLKLLGAAMSPSRFGRVITLMFNSLRGIRLRDIDDSKAETNARQEYRLYFILVSVAVAYTLLAGSMLLVYAWFIPMVFIAEPAHYLIELPEHFGLDAYNEPNFNRNTRSIEASWIARWYTNGNNLHTAHHSLASVPMGHCQALHDSARSAMEVIEPNYWTFYRKVMTGAIQPFKHRSE